MNKKYELTDETRETYSGVAYRIRAIRDFGLIKAGELGGFIEGEHNLSHEDDCWIADDAFVFGNAKVSGNAVIEGNCIIRDNALITDDASVVGNAQIIDNAKIAGNAQVGQNAIVCDNALVSDYAEVCGNARIEEHAKVFDYCKISDHVVVAGGSEIHGNAHLEDYVMVYGKSDISYYSIIGYTKIINGWLDKKHPYATISDVGDDCIESFTFYYGLDNNILSSSKNSIYHDSSDGFIEWCEVDDLINISSHQAEVVKQCGLMLLEAQTKK